MSEASPSFVTSLTYKFLLLTTTTAAAFFCWLYITKPTTISPHTSAEIATSQESTTKGTSASEDSFSLDNDIESSSASNKMSSTSFEAPSEDSFPGSKPSSSSSLAAVNPSSKNTPIPLANSVATGGKPSWEETNDSVQHVLTAQGDGASERIILKVPVIYMTRGMRLGQPIKTWQHLRITPSRNKPNFPAIKRIHDSFSTKHTTNHSLRTIPIYLDAHTHLCTHNLREKLIEAHLPPISILLRGFPTPHLLRKVVD